MESVLLSDLELCDMFSAYAILMLSNATPGPHKLVQNFPDYSPETLRYRQSLSPSKECTAWSGKLW